MAGMILGPRLSHKDAHQLEGQAGHHVFKGGCWLLCWVGAFSAAYYFVIMMTMYGWLQALSAQTEHLHLSPNSLPGTQDCLGCLGSNMLPGSLSGIFNASCWEGNFTEELCCNTAVSEVGLKDCWDSFYFYENCCPPEPSRLWRTSGAWLGTVRHENDDGLARELVNFYHSRKASSILDLGAGDGFYAGTLRAFGLRAGCFDGNPAVREVSKKRCFQADLSEECDLGQRWDWVMSLEVAEHVPRVFETTYLNNLDRHACTGILMSWAPPSQPGMGHVNGKSKEEVAFLFEQRGFWYNTTGSSWLSRKAHFPWLSNNIMVFERRQTARSLSECN